ncbi:MAG: hypothetical protein ABFS16_02805, partial [Bacteroidota bacterium]
MSDRVIRLGGSHIGNPTSIQNLKEYSGKSKGRKFVVVSAIPELLEVINKSIATVFLTGINADELHAKIQSFFTDRITEAVST